jgi:arginyl-tRNA synthetase
VTPDEVSNAIRAALGRVSAAGQPLGPLPTVIVVERPKSREHGDYATNIALTMAKATGMAPRDLAALLVAELAVTPGIAGVEVAGPGFVNIRLDASAQGEVARTIVTAGVTYGHGTTLAGRRINVEFISANPTGPLHLGHTRWAAVGDAIARVLEAAGADVVREFYINDRGAQMDKFGASVMAVAHGRKVPEDGYHGGYIADLAAGVVAEHPGIIELPDDDQLRAFREAAYTLQLAQQQRVLELFRTHFDVWSSEVALHESGAVDRALDRLRAQGQVFTEDKATWLRTSTHGDDKDRVLVRANGEHTYFASDAAYYVDKRARGFDTALYLLGADHHGYIGRLRALAACAGDNPDETLEILIGQMVKMLKDGEEVKLSKRAGTIVTLEELIEEVGVDAARYTLIRHPVDSPMTLDLDLISRASNDNPVFYVQYAHARISGVLRNAVQVGIEWQAADFDPSLLDHDRENDLLGMLAEYPRIVGTAAELREPHRVPRYLEDLATSYHRFYDLCRVLPRGDEPLEPIHIARLWLCGATRQVLSNGLGLCGVEAPERM